LENYSLETRPDFRKVSGDSVVELVGQPTASEEAIEVSKEAEVAVSSDELDVGLTLGNVPSALNGVASVNPGDTLAKAMTLMRLNDFSQLAVMSSPRTLKGAVTWRSIAKALAHDPEAKLSDAIEPAAEHPFDRDLVDVLAELYAKDFVFVRNSSNEVSGIVTTADVVLLYGETATPFFIIGEIDHLLRSFIADEWTVEQVVDVCDADDVRGIQSHDDLTFGDYQRMLEESGRFSSLEWPLDRSTFITRLDEIREMRNSVAHFEPDPLDPDDVASLRNFLNLLRDLRALP
jgi:CBS domain-containing protein